MIKTEIESRATKIRIYETISLRPDVICGVEALTLTKENVLCFLFCFLSTQMTFVPPNIQAHKVIFSEEEQYKEKGEEALRN